MFSNSFDMTLKELEEKIQLANENFNDLPDSDDDDLLDEEKSMHFAFEHAKYLSILYNLQGTKYVAADLYKEAIASFSSAISHYNYEPTYHRNLGLANYNQGNVRAAQLNFSEYKNFAQTIYAKTDAEQLCEMVREKQTPPRNAHKTVKSIIELQEKKLHKHNSPLLRAERTNSWVSRVSSCSSEDLSSDLSDLTI